MSEFLCKNGHVMLPSQGAKCVICGCRVGTMDGMSERQLKAEEAADLARGNEPEEPEEDVVERADREAMNE